MRYERASQSLWLSAFVLIFYSCNAKAEWFSNAAARMGYDSNLTNGTASENIVGASMAQFDAGAGQLIQLTDRDNLSLSTQFKGKVYDRLEGMNNLTLGLNADLKRKWGLGGAAPWTSICASANKLVYRDNVRSGWLYEVNAKMGKRLNEHWSISAEVGIDKRTADRYLQADADRSGAALDLNGRSFKLHGVYVINEQSFLTLGYSIRRGDVASTAFADTPGVNFDAVTTAVALDPAFGPNAEIYRIDGTTHSFIAALKFPIVSNGLLGIEYQREFTYANGDLRYKRSSPAITFSYFF